MSLRNRLLVSYIILLTVTLGIMTAALLLFLAAQPVSPNETYQQLATILQDAMRETEAQQPGQGRPLERLANLQEQLATYAEEYDTRVMIVNFNSRTVTYDSAGVYQRGESLETITEAYALPPFLQRRLMTIYETVFGRFNDKDGTAWLFGGVMATRQQNPNMNFALLLADVLPVQTLGDVLVAFGDSLAAPLLQAALVGLVIAAVLAAFISRNIARPLQRLGQAARKVAEGDYDQRVPAGGPPEIRAVGDAFNHMSAQVKASQQSQQDFMANVSHDLKTPLTSIQGFSQAIMEGAAKDPKDAAHVIHEEAGRLNRLVMQLTDLARLQAGAFSMQTQPIDTGRLTGAIGERLAMVANKKGVQLQTETPPMPEVMGDGDRLAQVLTNLVSNAIQYTPSGGHIWLKTQVNNGGVEIIVQDTGVGIPPEDLPRIFERFYQVDKARGPRRGTGLGLAITREIVAAHGGRIHVTSAGAGKGSTFTVWLPAPGLNGSTRGR